MEYLARRTQRVKDFLKPNYFMTKLDLSDAYYSIPIDKHSRHYLQFIFEGKLYQFKVFVFGLNTAPRIFQSVWSQLWLLFIQKVS